MGMTIEINESTTVVCERHDMPLTAGIRIDRNEIRVEPCAMCVAEATTAARRAFEADAERGNGNG